MATKAKEQVEKTVVDKEQKKEAVSVIDLLLGTDTGKVKLPTKQIEISRLTGLYGTPFHIVLQALSPDKWEELQDMTLEIKGKDVDLDTTLLQLFVLIESVLDINGKPLFKSKELMKHFDAVTPKELVKKILLPGEILSIYGEVSELSGFGDTAVTEVKN